MDPVEVFLNRLQHPVMAGIDLKLERMQRLLGLLGSPQKRMPPVVHVAGTNGKGSLIAYMQAVFEAAGYRVHRYTSPHLVHFRERIVLAGKEIENAYLETLVKHIASILPQQPATFFEATTAVAFLAFSEKPADIVLLETGMGGRLDSTNVIAKPLVTAITPVAFDHMEYLGDTIEKIAAEKAGIIKAGVPCVVGRQGFAAAAGVIAKKAGELNAPLYRLGHEWHSENGTYRSVRREIALHPSLPGAHQFDNAATAIACIEQMPQFAITDDHIAQGISHAVWPARLQHLTTGILATIPHGGIELWLDGGHNPQGGEVLAAWLASRGMETHLICGMLKGKDPTGFLAPLKPYATSLTAIAIPDDPQSQQPAVVAQAAKSLGIDADTADSIEKALQSVSARAKNPAIICICGSLYLAGKVLAANGEK